jgi:hypothetical protein
MTSTDQLWHVMPWHCELGAVYLFATPLESVKLLVEGSASESDAFHGLPVDSATSVKHRVVLARSGTIPSFLIRTGKIAIQIS